MSKVRWEGSESGLLFSGLAKVLYILIQLWYSETSPFLQRRARFLYSRLTLIHSAIDGLNGVRDQ